MPSLSENSFMALGPCASEVMSGYVRAASSILPDHRCK
jgi:hypothetical protein